MIDGPSEIAIAKAVESYKFFEERSALRGEVVAGGTLEFVCMSATVSALNRGEPIKLNDIGTAPDIEAYKQVLSFTRKVLKLED